MSKREEAIKLLVNATYSDEWQGNEDLTTAYNMAINSLEQESCEDAVSRKTVLNTLNRMDSVLDENRTVESYKILLEECYKNLPPVTPARKEERWVPCSERLPEDFQRVLVTVVNYNGDKVVRVAEYIKRTFRIKENYEQWNVGEKGLLAWIPLPRPYKAESEEI